MGFVDDFKRDLFLNSPKKFENDAIQLFHYQFSHNSVYRTFVQALGRSPAEVTGLTTIPYLPISLFKQHKVVSFDKPLSNHFESSGTTGSKTSKLYFYDELFYWQNTCFAFEHFFGELSQYSFFFLLPNYLERRNSSLVSMANHFYQKSNKSHGGFYLYDFESLKNDLSSALKKEGAKVILWGVTFALLDFASTSQEDYSGLLVFETGGMKGRGKEPVRDEVHAFLKKQLNVSQVYSEYGMTELFSQAYSMRQDIFTMPSSMRILIREPEDPMSIHQKPFERGGVNVVDLANVDSCAFIETQDIGMLTSENEFQILGRFDNSDIRGCNLLVI